MTSRTRPWMTPQRSVAMGGLLLFLSSFIAAVSFFAGGWRLVGGLTFAAIWGTLGAFNVFFGVRRLRRQKEGVPVSPLAWTPQGTAAPEGRQGPLP